VPNVTNNNDLGGPEPLIEPIAAGPVKSIPISVAVVPKIPILIAVAVVPKMPIPIAITVMPKMAIPIFLDDEHSLDSYGLHNLYRNALDLLDRLGFHEPHKHSVGRKGEM
jgi:hypothetical protein